MGPAKNVDPRVLREALGTIPEETDDELAAEDLVEVAAGAGGASVEVAVTLEVEGVRRARAAVFNLLDFLAPQALPPAPGCARKPISDDDADDHTDDDADDHTDDDADDHALEF